MKIYLIRIKNTADIIAIYQHECMAIYHAKELGPDAYVQGDFA
jgi:hypothetical protein